MIVVHSVVLSVISIHALRKEGDIPCPAGMPGMRHFYPRPPQGGRRHLRRQGRPGCRISIHALRKEGDRFARRACPKAPYFYPRPPQGGRLRDYLLAGLKQSDFYPRPPQGGRRHTHRRIFPRCCHFYPRPPQGGRLYAAKLWVYDREFLSTPSARRATRGHGWCGLTG